MEYFFLPCFGSKCNYFNIQPSRLTYISLWRRMAKCLPRSILEFSISTKCQLHLCWFSYAHMLLPHLLHHKRFSFLQQLNTYDSYSSNSLGKNLAELLSFPPFSMFGQCMQSDPHALPNISLLSKRRQHSSYPWPIIE